MITTWLSGKVVQIVVLALAVVGLICGPGMAVEAIRLNGLHVLGMAIFEGYQPRYEALVAQNEKDDLDRVTTALELAQKQGKAMADSNTQWLTVMAAFDGRIIALQNRIDDYVPQKTAIACVPARLLVLLDAAGSGASADEIPAAASIPDGQCSGISVRSAESILVQDLGQIPTLKARIENARDAWQAEYELTASP